MVSSPILRVRLCRTIPYRTSTTTSIVSQLFTSSSSASQSHTPTCTVITKTNHSYISHASVGVLDQVALHKSPDNDVLVNIPFEILCHNRTFPSSSESSQFPSVFSRMAKSSSNVIKLERCPLPLPHPPHCFPWKWSGKVFQKGIEWFRCLDSVWFLPVSCCKRSALLFDAPVVAGRSRCSLLEKIFSTVVLRGVYSVSLYVEKILSVDHGPRYSVATPKKYRSLDSTGRAKKSIYTLKFR